MEFPSSEHVDARSAQEQLLRRLSKAALHAAEHGRRSLLLRLTANNAQAVAELLEHAPLFYENDPRAPRLLLLEEGIKDALPQAFFDHPSAWLESQPNIFRPELHGRMQTETINDLWERPYDATRVKEFTLETEQGPVSVVSKRQSRRGIGTRETAVHRRALEAGLPTVRIYGEVVDHGNTYLLLEKWPGINLIALKEWLDEREQRTEMLQAEVTTAMEAGTGQFVAYGFSSTEAERLSVLAKERAPALAKQRIVKALHALCDHARRQQHYPGARLADPEQLVETEDVREMLRDTWNVEDIGSLLELPEFVIDQGLKRLRVRVVPTLAGIRRDIYQLCYRHLFAAEPIDRPALEQTLSDLASLCDARGVRHTDFLEGRNVLIGWDAQRNEPALGEDGRLELKLIDWEPLKEVVA